MTAVADATTVVETVLGHSVTAQTLTDIADAFLAADPFSVVANGLVTIANPANPTNEEKAQVFLKNVAIWGKRVMENVAAVQSDADAQGTKNVNVAAAGAKFS